MAVYKSGALDGLLYGSKNGDNSYEYSNLGLESDNDESTTDTTNDEDDDD